MWTKDEELYNAAARRVGAELLELTAHSPIRVTQEMFCATEHLHNQSTSGKYTAAELCGIARFLTDITSALLDNDNPRNQEPQTLEICGVTSVTDTQTVESYVKHDGEKVYRKATEITTQHGEMKTEVFDVGEQVWCDLCGEEYTNSDAVGGLLFGSKAVCPKCEPRMSASIAQYNEQHYIRGRAEEGETFKDFCLRLRGGDNNVTITSF